MANKSKYINFKYIFCLILYSLGLFFVPPEAALIYNIASAAIFLTALWRLWKHMFGNENDD